MLRGILLGNEPRFLQLKMIRKFLNAELSSLVVGK